MNKADLRKAYLQKMAALSKAESEEKSKIIADQFLSNFNLNEFSAIHTFLPIVKKNEINTWLIIDEVSKINPDLKIIISKSDFKTFEMTSHVFNQETSIVENAYGILEPHALEPYDEHNIDLIIVPLLAFDLKGYRVGYGKGFYDRFLLKCKKDIIKVGLSYFDPESEILDANEQDVPLDYCITPKKLFKFK